ncbi:MAG: helix-turn-helix domain-containing protein [Burkholderiaceae bacterium]
MASFKPVIAVSRALAVLRAVNALDPATVGSIHEATGLNKATIVRMLETLQYEGLVVRGAARNAYVPTGRTLQLSQGFDARRRIGALADPILDELRQRHGWPADVALFDVDAMIVVQSSADQGPLTFRRRPGFRAPMLVTSMGRAYLAHCAPAERDRIVERLRRVKDRWTTLSRRPAELASLLAEIRGRGFATMDDEYSEYAYDGTVWSIAVPIVDDTALYGSMNLMLVRSAMPLKSAETRLVPPLKQAATRLARLLTQAGMADT